MLSQHIQHGDIWKSASGNTVFVVQVPDLDDFIIFQADIKTDRVKADTPLAKSRFDPTADGAELIWRAPTPNNNNFNMTGNEARIISSALMLLHREQSQMNQTLLDRLAPIIQVQPPQG